MSAAPAAPAAPAPKMALYDIGAKLRLIDAMLDESGGEITPEVEAALDGLTDAYEQKVERIALLVRERQTQADAAEAEAKRLEALANSRARAADALKAYLARVMDATGRTKVAGSLISVSLCQNGRPSIRWPGQPESVPATYRREVVTFKIDSDAVYQAWKAGELPEGFEVVQGKHLRIK